MQRPAASSGGVVVIAAVLAGGLAGCQTLREAAPPLPGTGPVELTETQLRERLGEFVEYFEGRVVTAAQILERQTEDRALRRLAVEWQLRVVSAARSASLRPEALHSMVDLWTLCIQQAEYFESDSGRTAFQSLTPVALQASQDLRRKVEIIARRAFTESTYAEARDAVARFVRSHPLEEGFARSAAVSSLMEPSESLNPILWLLDLPLKPARALLDDTAKAMQEFTHTTDRVARMAQFVPRQALWEMELLLYDLEERHTIRTGLASFQQLTSSVAAVESRTRTLPATLRKEVRDLLKEASAHRETLVDLRHTVDSAQQGLGHLKRAGETWERTFQSVSELIEIAREDEEAASADGRAIGPEPLPSRPFDILDYAATAAAVDSAASALSQSVREARGLLSDVRAAEGLLEDAQGALEAVVARAFAFGLALILAVTACALGYRAATLRMLRSSESGRATPRAGELEETHRTA